MTRRTTTDRGYGGPHQKRRAEWAHRVAQGTVACARCGRIIAPGAPWDLDHHDGDRTRWLGPSHAHCNRSAGGRRGARKTNALRRLRSIARRQAAATTMQW